MTGKELIEKLTALGLDMAKAKVISTTLPEPDGEGGWFKPGPTLKRSLKVSDGVAKVTEREVPPYPMRYIEIDGWYIGPGGYRKTEDFDGWIGLARARDYEIEMTDDVEELAELLRARL